MKYFLIIVSMFFLFAGTLSVAQQVDDAKAETEQTEAERAKQQEEEEIKRAEEEKKRAEEDDQPREMPSAPRRSNDGFKPSTEISDDAPVPFPVDI